MDGVFKLSAAVSLALHTMMFLAKERSRPCSVKEAALFFKASEAHLAKVMQRLARAGLVDSNRGPKGGFVLGKKGVNITLLEIYQTIEGPFTDAYCLLDEPVCQGHCILGGLLQKINNEVKDYFSQTTLGSLMGEEENVA